MRFSTLLPVAALAAVVAAVPTDTTSSQCNTGPIQCCQTVTTASDPAVATLLGLLGIVVGDITGLVGLTCSPLNVIGGTGPQCAQQPLCCNNIYQNGLIDIGCSPVTVNA